MTVNSGALMAENYNSALGSGAPARSPSQGVPSVEAAAEELALPEAAALHNLATLVVAMRAGNERALEELYDATVGKLYALAMAILRNAEDAEEVVCETYSYAWANAARYDAGRGNVLGWLLMMCRSRALDRLRQRRASAVTVDISEFDEMHAGSAEQPDDILCLMQQRSTIYAALSKLAPERRRLVSLAFLQGLSHQQIAETTGLPLGTVKSHVRRALAQLRAALEGK
jgi:RNA polymerase sigma-70 factor, ECF subfamily